MARVTATVLRDALPGAGAGEFRRNIYVIFTSHESTMAALRTAGALAERWNASVTVVAPKQVPFPRDVADPDVATEFQEQQLADSLRLACVQVTVALYLCRNRTETLITILPPHSVIVIGVRRRWWRTREERLATSLRRAGHDVVMAPAE